MPWKESTVAEERLLFVARLIEGEPAQRPDHVATRRLPE
jgi:hypothetical protein